MGEEELKKLIDDRIKLFLKGNAFISSKITDTPTEAYSVVPRSFVTMNGAVASRPVSSIAVVGQKYFATDTGIPMTYSAAGWRNGVGSIVAASN